MDMSCLLKCCASSSTKGTRGSGCRLRATARTRRRYRSTSFSESAKHPKPGFRRIRRSDLTSRLSLDLAGPIGGDTGDGQPDAVAIDGTNGDDAITVSGGTGSVTTSGLAAVVAISHAEPANDTLTVKALAGDDVALATALAASSLALTLDGDTGDDILVGSAGNDVLFGREGDDILLGGPGQDVLDGGPGNNVLIQD